MGIYLNPGKTAYEEAVNSEIFVDKTEMLLYLNSVLRTKQKYVSVSRPRRFGKTMAADMVCAYYDRSADSRKLFEKLKISGDKTPNAQSAWNEHLGKYDVIRIMMTDFIKAGLNVDEILERLQRRVVRDLLKEYPDTDCFDDSDLAQTLSDIYGETQRQFVIVIDEWDALFRVKKEDIQGQTQYLDFLRDLLKDKSYIALAYMTGILPIKKYGEHSALNMFDEYSMMAPMQLAPYSGFTEDEVKDLCRRYGRNYEEIRDWYDGYEVSDVIPPDPDHEKQNRTGQEPRAHRYALYSPLSVVQAVRTGRVMNYWNKTETYEALAEYIRRDYDGLKEAVALLMDGGRLPIDISTYQNDMTTFTGRDDILSLLIHLGYLGYDDENREVFIPNREILDEFKTSTKSREWADTFRSFDLSLELLHATWDADEERVAELLENAHDRAGNRTYNDEAALSYSIQLAYYAAQKYYTTVLELDTGKGYADVVYLPSPKHSDKPAILVELKYDRSAKGAIEQIRKQRYPQRLEHYLDNLLLVGINYDKDVSNSDKSFKHHSCRIERYGV